MGNALTQKEQKVVAARAWRVFFDRREEGEETIAVREPRNVAVVLKPIEPQEALAQGAPAEDGSLDLIWMPPGANYPLNVEREAESWLDDAATALRRYPVRAGIRTVRVFWHDSRVLLYANPEQVNDAIDAIIRFTATERELSALDTAIAANWGVIDTDATLTHDVARRDQSRQTHVNEMTERATRMQMSRLRVERALEQLDPRLVESSKRLYAELSLAAAQHDRLDLIDEPIQFALDHYELANTRLIEAKNASKDRALALTGHALEVVIVFLLLAELLVTVLAIRIGG